VQKKSLEYFSNSRPLLRRKQKLLFVVFDVIMALENTTISSSRTSYLQMA